MCSHEAALFVKTRLTRQDAGMALPDDTAVRTGLRSVQLIRKNAVANFLGRGWSALVPLALSPYYVALFGPEGFGLIGVYLMLQALLVVLDLGYGTTVSREMARLTEDITQRARARDLMRTLEVFFFGALFIIGAGIYAAAPALGENWSASGGLTHADLSAAFRLIGLGIAAQFPSLLYAGGLMGLQRQVVTNSVLAAISTLRWVGGAVILMILPPTLELFFAWQILASALQSTLMGYFMWSALRQAGHKPRISMQPLRSTWRYAAGVAGAATLGALLVNLDKVVLTQLVPLESYGYYSLAWLAASCIAFLVAPIYAATFPRFCQLANAPSSELRSFFHATNQVAAVVVIPVAAILVFFSDSIMAIWLTDATSAGRVAPLVSILVIGHALNSLMTVPYALLLGTGHSKFGLIINLVSVMVLAPTVLVLTLWLGALGAAAAWMILNIGYVVIAAPLMLQLTLPNSAGAWLRTDIAPPLAVCLIIGGLGAYLEPSPGSTLASLSYIIVIFLLCAIAAAVCAPFVRQQLRQALRSQQPE